MAQALTGGCSSSDSSADTRPRCSSHSDCSRFGNASCLDGFCTSDGLTCAASIGMDGTAPSGGPGSDTVAAVFDEWFITANAAMSTWCSELGSCMSGTAGPCYESSPWPPATTCCKTALDYYVAHRAEIQGCASATVTCEQKTFSDVCPPLATMLGSCEKG